jgi:hypothetical protein
MHIELGKVAEIRALLGSEDPELLHDAIEGQTDLFEIIDWLLGRLADEEEMAVAIVARADALYKRAEACTGRQKRLRDALLACMEASGQKSLRRPEATLTLSARKQGIQAIDETTLPERFWKTERKVSRSLVMQALAAGEAVPGVLVDNGGVSLAIRRK